MEIKISDEKENALFKRKEISGTSESEVTPSREQVLESLSKKFSVPAENIKIKGIRNKYGSREFEIEANIYSSVEEKNSIEIKKKKEQIKAVEEKPVEAVQEQPVQEVPKEEPKQENQEGKSDQPAQEKSEERMEEEKKESEEKSEGEPDKEPSGVSEEIKEESQ